VTPKLTRFHPYNTRSSNHSLSSSTTVSPKPVSVSLASKKRPRREDDEFDEVPLAVLKKIKRGPTIQSNIHLMEQAALSLTSLKFAAPYSALSPPGPLAIAAKPPDILQPSLSYPKGLSTEPYIGLIHSPYDDAPSAMVIDMEATLC